MCTIPTVSQREHVSRMFHLCFIHVSCNVSCKAIICCSMILKNKNATNYLYFKFNLAFTILKI